MEGAVRVHLSERGADAERQTELARMLRAELLQLDVEDVRPLSTGPPPPGARGVDAAAVGALLIAMGQSAGALRAVIMTATSWLSRGDSSRSVRIEVGGEVLEITRSTQADEARLVDLFIQRHTTAGGEPWTANERP